MDDGTADRIQWREWGESALAEARDRGLPVLLAIGATWCHWCHVMDETTYSDPCVISAVNEGFIPVRVDTDRRPDVNRRYNMGGWPTTAFLNPEGAVLTGFTYAPAAEFKRVLDSVSRVYCESPSIREARSLDTGDGGYLDAPPVEGPVDPGIVEAFRSAVERSFDRRHGGFGTQPKFPHAEALDFALEMHARTGNEGLLGIVTRTLDGMAGGGMYDRMMGGFFRYSTTRDWSVPHFEKMLEDNSRLLLTYSSAYRVTGREQYRRVCTEIMDYLDSTLRREAGGHYGSQDADEEYYRLPLEERTERTPPRVDRAVYVNWNALLASSLVRASKYLDEPAYAERAARIIDSLLKEGYARGEGMCHFIDDSGPHGGGLFEDQIEMCSALLDLCAQQPLRRAVDDYRDAARDLLADCLAGYWDERDGGFFDIRVRGGKPAAGALKAPVKSLEQNARAAEVLRRAATLADPASLAVDYRDKAERSLRAFAGSHQDHGLVAAPYAIAVLHHLYPVRVEVAGPRDGARTRDALRTMGSEFLPGADVLYTGPLPEGQEGPVVRVCAGTTCLPPAHTVEEAVRVAREAYRLPVGEEEHLTLEKAHRR
ncbi:MAG: thioredoxin domain-containing protein [Ignavibacteriales bacterium]